jgi:RNA polymerase sigma-70 factor (ECF subfamily)
MRTPTARVELSDPALVEAARTGDREALAELLNRHRPMLLALCRRALGDEDLAADAAQEAALGALLGLDRLRRPDRFGAWLAGIGLNVCRRWLRQRSRASWSWEAVAGGVHWRESLDGGRDPADEVVASDLAARVRHAVDGLPAGQRQAVVLMYFTGMTQAEVAAELGIPVSAVKARLHKGRAALRVRLWRFRRNEMPVIPSDTGTLVPMELREVVRMRGDQWPGAHVVCLAEIGGERILPIWVGDFEATWLALAIEKVEMPRPGPYALMARTIQAVGGRLLEVRISRLADEVFYAEIACEDSQGRRRTIDARPSDALNLAAILDVPVFAAPEVVQAAGRRAGPDVHRALTEQRSEAVDAATADLAAEARERWTSSLAQVHAVRKRLEDEEGAGC